MNNTNFRNDESNSIGILHYLKSRISDNATRGYETKVDENDEEDPWEFNVSLADIVRNHEYINTIATRGVDSRKWESLAVDYVVTITKELDCDLNKAMSLMDYVGYWAIPNRYKIKNSDKLKTYFLLATETQLAIWDAAKLLIDRTEAWSCPLKTGHFQD
ncbi:hypothetical protein [Ochrobactrum sp. CGA5]|uniref:hypothetical protein n=1 Tax=Ochrobactrum sp. CGA5 TaxID=2583453 RepID=UPI0011236D15|nr:hypothetical protein [Ochrobactrum sp. CGA5]